jgi:UDP-glucose 4-epimerase
MTRYVVTGGAGFIGSTRIDRLLADGHTVTAYDNLSTGQLRFLEKATPHRNFKLVEGDLLDEPKLNDAIKGHDFVFHFAANADVRFGTNHPRRDLEQNTIATYNVLEAMRGANIKRIGFSSTGSVYGEAAVIPTPEDAPFPIPTSLYGASKLAGEGLIAAYGTGFGVTGFVFRFVSILGERYSHGHVYDFYRQLKADPTKLKVLGNGKQRKSYLYVGDCVDAILTVIEKGPQEPGMSVHNLGADEYCEVNDSIGWICNKMGVKPESSYTGGERGWIGDNPFIFLETKKVRSLGWKPKLTIKQGVEKTVEYLAANQWLFESRH